MFGGVSPYVTLTPPGLLGVVVMMILLGWLVPIRIVRGRLVDKDAVIASKDVVIAEQARTIDVLKRNNQALLRGNATTVQILDATSEAVGGDVEVA